MSYGRMGDQLDADMAAEGIANNRRNREIGARVTPEQWEAIKEVAAGRAPTMSAFIRDAVLLVTADPSLLDGGAGVAADPGDLIGHLQQLATDVVVSGQQPPDEVARLVRVIARQLPREGYTM